MLRNKAQSAAVFGIDIGKNVFHVIGIDTGGHVIQKAKFRRDTLLQFFESARRTVVAMEACPGSQWLARKLRQLGHSVRVIPAQFVKPYVKSNKNDIIDAEAIAEAATRPSMRFVEVKSEAQVDIQALHRIRDQKVSLRTQLVCQMRAFCLEYGIAIHQGIGKFKADFPRVLANEGNDLTPMMRRTLCRLFEDFGHIEDRIAEITREIEALAASDERTRRLMTVPGIGPLVATAFVASAGNASQFRRAKDLAAWLGLVPREHSTGGKTTLLGISKRGNHYLRRLLIHGARSCVMHLNRTSDRLGSWLTGLEKRMHVNKVTVALAAKIARVAWVILTRPGSTYERRLPALA
ncbi:IS110 family transposase [Bradyrhizobium sp. Pa8]|uniref:IS110 family transposase n=1 Tax=Bradyrhizobium sp. Pa8 TaxID=3386552 RepID=UPI00403EFA47